MEEENYGFEAMESYADLLADAMEHELEEHHVWDTDGNACFESRFQNQ